MSFTNIKHRRADGFGKALILYVMFALLFVMPLKLHIHTADEAPFQAHEAAVDFSLEFSQSADQMMSEIDVSVNKLIKQLPSMDLGAAILLLLLLIVMICGYLIRIKSEQSPPRPVSRSYFLPDTRAPPAHPSL